MNRNDARGTPAARATRMPRKRFRLDKLEERIAPKLHQNPHTKWVGGGNGTDSSIY